MLLDSEVRAVTVSEALHQRGGSISPMGQVKASSENKIYDVEPKSPIQRPVIEAILVVAEAARA